MFSIACPRSTTTASCHDLLASEAATGKESGALADTSTGASSTRIKGPDDSALTSAAIPFNAQYVAATARTEEVVRIAMRFTIVSLVVDCRWVTCSMTTSASSV